MDNSVQIVYEKGICLILFVEISIFTSCKIKNRMDVIKNYYICEKQNDIRYESFCFNSLRSDIRSCIFFFV